MSAVPHHVHGFDRAAPEHEPPNVVAANAVLALAREAVRMAVEHGGDQAAGALRLLLNELSPMPLCMAPSDSPPSSRPEGAGVLRQFVPADGSPIKTLADLNLMARSGARALREMAKRARVEASTKQLTAYADTFALVARLTAGTTDGGSDA